MASQSSSSQLKKLQANNKRLQRENAELRKLLNGKEGKRGWSIGNLARKIGVILFIGLAVAFLVTGNLFFWLGNTATKTDRYVAATAPIIKNAEVQNALASKLSHQLFMSVNVEQVIEDGLPPRVAFLAPTITDQALQHTDDALLKIFQRPEFQKRWNDAQERSHARFIQLINDHGSDGSIDIGEVYTQATAQLTDTRLAFLANKPLPEKFGKIQIASGSWVSAMQKTIANIDTWRTIAILLLFLFSALGVWLSHNRRKTVIILASFWAISMFLTALAARLTREMIADKADPLYAEAVRQSYSIIMHSLAVQTFTLMALAMVIAFVAWISGPYKSSLSVRRKTDQLFSGKLHQFLFAQENGLSRWFGIHKKTLQWLIIVLVAGSLLFIKLTPAVLLKQTTIALLLVLIIEVLAAQPAKKTA